MIPEYKLSFKSSILSSAPDIIKYQKSERVSSSQPCHGITPQYRWHFDFLISFSGSNNTFFLHGKAWHSKNVHFEFRCPHISAQDNQIFRQTQECWRSYAHEPRYEDTNIQKRTFSLATVHHKPKWSWSWDLMRIQSYPFALVKSASCIPQQ